MKVTVFNVKGGVGKSPISVALSEHLPNSGIISNEKSDAYMSNFSFYEYSSDPVGYAGIIEDKYDHIIFDFAGDYSAHVINATKVSDVLIVPTVRDLDALQKTVNVINELKDYGTPILAVVTKTKPGGDPMVEDMIFDNFGDEVPVFHLRETKLFLNSLALGQRPIEYVEKGVPLYRSTYRNILTEMGELAEAVKILGGE